MGKREPKESKTPTQVKMATSASSESESKRDTVVNISGGTEKTREEATTIGLAVEEASHNKMVICDETHLTMDPMLDRAPPPPYQEHNPLYQSPPSAPNHPFPPSTLPSLIYPSLPSRSSPPPSYSQIDLRNYHFPSAPQHLPSQLGGARRQKLQQTNQQLTNKEMTVALRRAGVTNGQRIVNVRLKEEQEEEQEEMSSMRKGGVAVSIFVIMFFIIYLCLPYTDFSPWD